VEEGSSLPDFDQIMAYIGDDQDIQTGLSTFSAHAAHLRYLVEHANQKSLVIIDEPGMGTDPDEGVALAMAVLDFLYQEGAFVAVSTHFNRLKTYGLLNPRAVNASVEFDTARNRPTFRLKYGSCGISHALEVARDIGVPVTILERARGYLDHDQVHLNSVIEKLNRLMSETSREKMEAEEVKLEYHGAAREMRERLNKLENEKRALMETKKAEASQAISKAKEEFKKAINLLKMKKEPVQAYVTERYAEVGRELMNHLEQETNDKTQADLGEWEEGQTVYHKRLKQEGIVQSIDSASGRIMLMLGKVKVSAGIEDLQTVDEVREFNPNEMPKEVSWHLEDSPLKELNVIGYRVDDAIPLIDKTIDRALIDGQLSLRIIHGFGTGKLREAIRAHLKETPSVNKVYSADAKSGGDAITIVEF
jgi:DNA mismatch repair protein MutS2